VWTNLVANAVKYSSRNPHARVSVFAVAEPTRVVYSVRDNGVGFDMNNAGKMFGVFQRLHRLDQFPGTGVGLAIVKRIVERHGGTVWATSRVGEGATFSFALPTHD
jgi:light-regulated signal transduction histidine kinase (bacteriophytochrome)